MKMNDLEVSKEKIEKQNAIEILMDLQSDWEDGKEYNAIELAIKSIEKE